MQTQPKISEYDQQALDFLESTGTSFDIQYLYTGTYFEGDTEERDIYQFTLKNDKGAYSSKFGDSIYNTKQGMKPSAYDVLACLETYCPDTFEDFCDEYGYQDRPLSEHDSVMRIYLNVREQAQALRKLFSPEQLEQLADIN